MYSLYEKKIIVVIREVEKHSQDNFQGKSCVVFAFFFFKRKDQLLGPGVKTKRMFLWQKEAGDAGVPGWGEEKDDKTGQGEREARASKMARNPVFCSAQTSEDLSQVSKFMDENRRFMSCYGMWLCGN